MSELLFKVMLKADGSGLVGQTRLSAEEVKKLTAAVGASEKAAGKLTQATGQMAEAEVRAAQAAAQLQAAQARGQSAAIVLAKAQDAATGVDETNDKLAELLGITREMVASLQAMGGIGAIASSAAFAFRGA